MKKMGKSVTGVVIGMGIAMICMGLGIFPAM